MRDVYIRWTIQPNRPWHLVTAESHSIQKRDNKGRFWPMSYATLEQANTAADRVARTTPRNSTIRYPGEEPR